MFLNNIFKHPLQRKSEVLGEVLIGTGGITFHEVRHAFKDVVDALKSHDLPDLEIPTYEGFLSVWDHYVPGNVRFYSVVGGIRTVTGEDKSMEFGENAEGTIQAIHALVTKPCSPFTQLVAHVVHAGFTPHLRLPLTHRNHRFTAARGGLAYIEERRWYGWKKLQRNT